MIPESGSHSEFKRAVFDNTSVEPLVGERYLADWGERKTWVVVEVMPREIRVVSKPGDIPDYISRDSWNAYRYDYQGILKYVGNDS